MPHRGAGTDVEEEELVEGLQRGRCSLWKGFELVGALGCGGRGWEAGHSKLS